MVQISTDFVFDGLSSQGYRADDATAPLGVYGRTKLANERASAAGQPGCLIVRSAWISSAVGTNFLTTTLRLMRERNEVSVLTDQMSTPTHARSLAGVVGAGPPKHSRKASFY
jgi:dTDP-4-dehydrorhamnose reductase